MIPTSRDRDHRVRAARPDDIPRLFAIRQGAAAHPLTAPDAMTPVDCQAAIAEAAIFVWEEHDEVLGFSTAEVGRGHVGSLCVAPGHDGRGIGRALLAHACARLRAAGLGAAVLRVGGGTRAEGFYRAAGWLEDGRDDRGDITFRLPLGAAGDPVRA